MCRRASNNASSNVTCERALVTINISHYVTVSLRLSTLLTELFSVGELEQSG